MRPSDLHIDLDSFAGPFDLLCTILLRRELPVQDVTLAEVVVGYVQRLAMQDEVDPETASEFLLLVAALLEIKAREVLAIEDTVDIVEPVPLEARDEMLDRLIRYTTFRNAAQWLGRTGRLGRFWREAAPPVIRRHRTYDGPTLDPALLAQRIGVLLAEPDVDVRHLVGKHASVHEMSARLLELVRTRRSFDFDDAVDGLSRLDQAVAFVAALELARSGKLALTQPAAFGPISIEYAEPAELPGEVQSGDDDAAKETEFQIA